MPTRMNGKIGAWNEWRWKKYFVAVVDESLMSWSILKWHLRRPKTCFPHVRFNANGILVYSDYWIYVRLVIGTIAFRPQPPHQHTHRHRQTDQRNVNEIRVAKTTFSDHRRRREAERRRKIHININWLIRTAARRRRPGRLRYFVHVKFVDKFISIGIMMLACWRTLCQNHWLCST